MVDLPPDLTDSDIVRLLRSKEYKDRRKGLAALLPDHSSMLVTTNGLKQAFADSEHGNPDQLQSALLYAQSKVAQALGQVLMVGVTPDPRKQVVLPAGPNPLGRLMR